MRKTQSIDNYQTNVRNDVIKFILNRKIHPKKIFEFGGGSGFTSEKLCEIFKCNATNLDLSIPKLRSNKIHHIEGDINEINLIKEIKNDKFDLILALDFIEHIKDTEKLMRIIKNISKTSATILPNIICEIILPIYRWVLIMILIFSTLIIGIIFTLFGVHIIGFITTDFTLLIDSLGRDTVGL